MNRIAVLALAVPLLFAQSREPITSAEREYAIAYLEKTKAQYVQLISRASDAQWKFKAGPDRWSVAECAEHIALTEDNIHNGMLKLLDRPRAAAEDLAKARAKDDRIVATILDRTQKREAPPSIRPTNRWPTRDETLTNFVASRDRVIAYLRTTKDDLHGHLGSHAVLGPLTAYQWYIAMAAHTQRHLDQAEEVTREASFPK